MKSRPDPLLDWSWNKLIRTSSQLSLEQIKTHVSNNEVDRSNASANVSVQCAGPNLSVGRHGECRPTNVEVEVLEIVVLLLRDREQSSVGVHRAACHGFVLVESVRSKEHERRASVDNAGSGRENFGRPVVNGLVNTPVELCG